MPETVPPALIALAHIGIVQTSLVSAHVVFARLLHNKINYLLLHVTSFTMFVLLVQSLRLRNRHRFAAVTAARESLERWTAIRAKLERQFSCVMPRAVAERLCACDASSTSPGASANDTRDGDSEVWAEEMSEKKSDEARGLVEDTASSSKAGVAKWGAGIFGPSFEYIAEGVFFALRLDTPTQHCLVHKADGAPSLPPREPSPLFQRSNGLLVNRAAALQFVLSELEVFDPFPFAAASAFVVLVPCGCAAVARQATAAFESAVLALRESGRACGIRVVAASERGSAAGALVGSAAQRYVVTGAAIVRVLDAIFC